MTSLACYSLTIVPPAPPQCAEPRPNAPVMESCLDLQIGTGKRGSFAYDQERGQWPLEWEDLADFEAWRREEELLHSIEIISSTTAHGGKRSLWTKRCVFVCGRAWSGGKSKYEKKNPDRKQKIQNKKIGCGYRLISKHYPDTPIILGHLEREHDHETGLLNIAYTRMSRHAREKIKFMLRQ